MSVLPKSIEDVESIRASCKTMVKKRALASSGAVLVPVPGVDIAADVAMLLELLPSINRKFGLTPEQIDELDPQLKSLLYGIIKRAGTNLVGQLITKQLIMAVLKKVGVRMTAKQVLKYIPFVGQAAAAALSGSAMMFVGYAHIDECYEVAKRAVEYTSQTTAST
jgi:uncharacterized protein (DUF697 family)